MAERKNNKRQKRYGWEKMETWEQKNKQSDNGTDKNRIVQQCRENEERGGGGMRGKNKLFVWQPIRNNTHILSYATQLNYKVKEMVSDYYNGRFLGNKDFYSLILILHCDVYNLCKE